MWHRASSDRGMDIGSGRFRDFFVHARRSFLFCVMLGKLNVLLFGAWLFGRASECSRNVTKNPKLLTFHAMVTPLDVVMIMFLGPGASTDYVRLPSQCDFGQ